MANRVYGIYARISKDRDGARAGVKRQIEDCEKLARECGVATFHYVDNDISAYSGKPRHEYLRLLGDLKAGVITGVVCWHPDRLHRSPRELEDFIDIIEATGAEVLTVQAGDLDLSTATGRGVARIVGSIARMESEHKSDRLKRKHREIAEAGGWSGGPRPYGYDTDGSSLRIVDAEAKLIRKAATDVLAGKSVRSIALGWNEAGVPSTKDRGWTPQVVRHMLLSPVIRGEREHRGVRVRALWKEILDHSTALAVEARLTNAQRSASTFTARKWPLAGFVICGLCGSRMVSARSNGVPAMACKVSATPTSCGRIIVSMKPLEELVGTWAVERLLLSPKALATAAESKETGADEVAITAELASLDIASDQLNAEFLAGTITAVRLGQLAQSLESKRETLMARLAAVSTESARSSLPTDRESLTAIWNDGDLDTRRVMLSLVFTKIEIGPAAHKGARFNRDRVKPHFRGAQPAH